MRNTLPTALALSLLATACSTTQRAHDEAASPAASAAPARQAGSGAPVGVVTPGEFTALSLWPEAYQGELLVLEVKPQGSAVAAGDVLAKLETRAIDEQISSAQLELDSATVKHEGLLERHRIAQEAADAKLERARADLERARRSLEGYENHELAFARRADELSEQREKARLDDQSDELGQLEAMYNADELTDATEEIVLKREQRNLAFLRDANALSADRRTYRNEFEVAMESERRREAVAQRGMELEHLTRTQATEKAAREDAERRSAAELEKKGERLARLQRDRELFTVTAPHAGTLLHGEVEDYRPGKTATRLSRASKLAPRSNFLLVMQPGKLAVAMEIGESSLETLADGTSVKLTPVSGSGGSVDGTLKVSAYPTGQKGTEATHEGRIEITSSASGWTPGMYVRVQPAGDAAPDAVEASDG